jgi:nickel-dependent lactate racemase
MNLAVTTSNKHLWLAQASSSGTPVLVTKLLDIFGAVLRMGMPFLGEQTGFEGYEKATLPGGAKMEEVLPPLIIFLKELTKSDAESRKIIKDVLLPEDM